MYINYLNYTFTKSDILNLNIVEEKAPISETLSANGLSSNIHFYFDVRYEGFYTSEGLLFCPSDYPGGMTCRVYDSTEPTLDHFVYGTPLYVYNDDDDLTHKMYVKTVRRTAQYTFAFECQSIIGLLISATYRGGICAPGTNAKQVIASIMNAAGVPSGYYSIDDDLENVMVSGYLGIQNCRDALQSLCFAEGISITYDDDYDIVFSFFNPGTAKAINTIYASGISRQYLTPATKVTVYEHTYIAIDGTDEEVVYDDATNLASGYEVQFGKPYFGYRAEGNITITESAANYIIINGTGRVFAKPYTHSTRAVSKTTGASGETKEYTVENATLVTSLNVENVLERVSDYYAQATETKYSFVVTDQRPGDLVSFTDPITKAATTGYIKDMTTNVSGINKASATISTEWEPSHFGNTWTHYSLLTGNGTFSVPSGVTKLKVIIGGAGNGGHKGDNGTASGTRIDAWTEQLVQEQGKGGAGKEAGLPGRTLAVVIDNPSASYSYTCGIGGSGGTATADPTEGTASRFGNYSSASGSVPENGVFNPMTGALYSTNGRHGVDGADGGLCNYSEQNPSGQGGSVSAKYNLSDATDTVWSGGGVNHKTWLKDVAAYDHGGYYWSGAGGGAAFGSAGTNGLEGSWSYSDYRGVYSTQGGNGAKGADAMQFPDTIPLGGGGHGGSGGGGGADPGSHYYYNSYRSEDVTGLGTAGAGGLGANGSNGGNGYIICLW